MAIATIGEKLEASVCSIDARSFGCALSIEEAICCKAGFQGFTDLQGWRFGVAPAESSALRRAGHRALATLGWQGGSSLLGSESCEFSSVGLTRLRPSADPHEVAAQPIASALDTGSCSRSDLPRVLGLGRRCRRYRLRSVRGWGERALRSVTRGRNMR